MTLKLVLYLQRNNHFDCSFLFVRISMVNNLNDKELKTWWQKDLELDSIPGSWARKNISRVD